MKPSDLKEALRIAIKNRLPLLIVGSPGIGKTDIVTQAANEENADLEVFHPVVSDPTDPKGLPWMFKDKTGNPRAEFIPYGSLRRLMEATTSTIAFFDDLGQAAPAVQASYMQLFLARRINGHKVSDLVTFLAATNRRSDKAGVTGILEPVKSRFASILNLEPDLNDWTAWALNNRIPTELIAFLRFRPELLHNFKPSTDMVNSPSPRTWHNVAKLILARPPVNLEFELFSGAVGETAATEFLAFLKIFRTLPNPDMVLMAPETADLPSDICTLYALCGALAQRAGENNFSNLVTYAKRLSPEFSVMLYKDCITRNKALLNTKASIDWQCKHADILI